jgi:hypothetical protein
MKYSDFAHIPWALGIMAAGLALFVAGVPISLLAALAGAASMIARAVTKGEYQGIEEKFGGLRVNMPAWYGFKFWYWNSHTKLETLYAVVAALAVAIPVHLLSLRLIGVAL